MHDVGRVSVGLLATSLLLSACPSGEATDASTSTTGIATASDTNDDEVGDTLGEEEESSDDGPSLDMPPEESDEVDTGEECAAVSEQAENELAPVDIIFAIDTSGSMSDEKNFVQQQMNIFSQQIFLANIDHHVVMIAEESPDGPCINVPLGSGNCPQDTKLPEYLHVFQTVGSSNALDQILATEPEWSTALRPGSIKHFVVVSDDNSGMAAQTFHDALVALNPEYASYIFHAIVAFEAPDPLECFGGASCCAGPIPLSADVGDVYIELVNSSGGVAGDLCDQEFGPVFNQIAQSVQTTVPLACEWDIPDPPEGETFDPTKVNVELTLDGVLEEVYFVESANDCMGGDGWYYLPDNVAPEQIRICPETCLRVQDATEASVDILFGCETVPVE